MMRSTLPQTCISLSNNAQGVLAHAPHLTHAYVSMAFAAGYLDEPSARPGLAHLLEHVLTTAPLEAPVHTSLLSWFGKHQGSLNAHTDDHVTDVHFAIPVSRLEEAALTVAGQLAKPNMLLATVRSEVAAIDAEWHARHNSRQMQRLGALAALADSAHIGASCRHGNAQTLGDDAAALADALATFHRAHYHGGRLSVAILSSWATADMARLARQIAALFNPPPTHASTFSSTPSATLAIAPRWGRRCSTKVAAADNTVEFLWPLPPATSRHQLTALIDLADSLNNGHLVEQLPAAVTDVCATAAPEGATDSFSLRLTGAMQPENVLAKLTERLNEQLREQLNKHVNTRLWQPPADTVQLAPAWFSHARRQLLLRRFEQPTADCSPFTVSNARWLIGDAAALPSPPAVRGRPAPTPNVRCWCGQYAVSSDFKTLAETGWAACFVPGAVITPSPLTAQRLARMCIVLKQAQTPLGSWVMAVGRGANPAMLTLIQQASLTATAQEGLLAQQLVQRLATLPDTPAVWVSHPEELGAMTRALAALAARPLAAENRPTNATSVANTQPASTALMRTLSLPGTPAQRWLLALAEQQHSAPFFQQARDEHRLGYVAAVRRGDGAPCSLGYVVQTSNDPGAVNASLTAITDALWQGTDDTLLNQRPSLPALPETPLAALIAQWQSLLAGTTQPLHRLAQESLLGALRELPTSMPARWQTHWLDSTGHYRISD